jgi:outer membrane autotransporter protein
VTPNGNVILAVSTTEGDGTFPFRSGTPALGVSVSTSGGTGQSGSIALNPGTYTATVSLPDGFGLTGISCSDGDSNGSVTARSVTIVLAPAEAVTCTFSSANTRTKTVEVISNFMNTRNDLQLSNGPDSDRQIDRLKEANEASGSTEGSSSGFSEGGAGLGSGASRLGGEPVGFSMGTSPQSPRAGGDRISAHSMTSEIGAALNAMRAVDREDETLPGIAPLGFSASTEGGTQFSFSASLSQVAKYYESAEQRKISDQLGDAMGVADLKLPSRKATFSPFDIWVEGRYMDFSDDRDGDDSDGSFGVVYVGADYVASSWLLVGALIQYDSLEQKSYRDQYEIKGHGFMAGPYATARLSDHVYVQGRAAWGTSDNEVSPFLTYTDRFETDRWLVSGTLKGDWEYGAWIIRPSAELAYVEDTSEAYTDSMGVTIPALKASLGQVKAGPEISYRTQLDDGTLIQPHMSVDVIWNFDSSDEVVNFGGTLEGPEEVRGRIEVGIKAQLAGTLSIDVSGTYDGIGSDNFSAYGGQMRVNLPFN